MAVIDADEAELVTKIFDWYINHDSGYGEIVVKLSEAGYMVNNQPFKKHNVKGILTNPFYTGMLLGGQFEPYEGNHTPIVSKTVFEQAQTIRMRKQKNRSKQEGFKLRQKIICPKCQTTLTPNQQRKLSKTYRYYVCSICKKTSVSANKIEEESCQLVKDYLLESSQFKKLIKSLQKQHNDLLKKKSRRTISIKIEKEKLMTLFEEGKLTQENLIEKLKALEGTQNEGKVYIDQKKLEQTLHKLMKLQKSPVDDVLFQQIEKIVLTTNKKIKEIFINGIPISIV